MLVSDVSVSEANSGSVNAAVTVTLSNDTDDVVTVNFATADGMAVSGTDFAADRNADVPARRDEQVITVVISPASAGEGGEWFTVVLSGAATRRSQTVRRWMDRSAVVMAHDDVRSSAPARLARDPTWRTRRRRGRLPGP
jgi:hypothetical protein